MQYLTLTAWREQKLSSVYIKQEIIYIHNLFEMQGVIITVKFFS